MIEIGRTSLRPVRRKDKATGKLVKAYDEHDQPLTRIVANEVVRVTRNTLGGTFGPDGKRKLVVKLAAGDVLVMWPQGTRQKVSIELKQVYREAIQRRAMLAVLERARKRKAAKATQRASRRLRYAEANLRKPINNVNDWAEREALG